DSKAAARVAEQFQKHQVRKVYWALVEGAVQSAEGTWEDWVRKLPDVARAEIVSPDTEGAKQAVLDYRVRHSGPDESWLELSPRTGRMHQLRVQAAARGHPVRGAALCG